MSIATMVESLLFLPYVNGINTSHDLFDFARAVMEGVAHLLQKNITEFENAGIEASQIISTGGGAKSDFWATLKADITGLPVVIPEKIEAACYGAAIMGAVSSRRFEDFESAVRECVSFRKKVMPSDSAFYVKKHKLFKCIYNRLFGF